MSLSNIIQDNINYSNELLVVKTSVPILRDNSKNNYPIFPINLPSFAGQPAFDQVRAIYFKQAVGALLIFDITRPDTLDNLKRWMRELSVHSGSQNISVIVLGNKIDLQDESMNTIDSEKAIDFIKGQLTAKFDNIDNNISYFETSAKTGENMDNVFQELGLRIYKKLNS